MAHAWNGCSQSSRFPTAGQRERGSGNENACGWEFHACSNSDLGGFLFCDLPCCPSEKTHNFHVNISSFLRWNSFNFYRAVISVNAFRLPIHQENLWTNFLIGAKKHKFAKSDETTFVTSIFFGFQKIPLDKFRFMSKLWRFLPKEMREN